MDANRMLGRPRSHDIDRSILDSAVGLLASKGPDGVTIKAVADRSGVARASIYLRYPTRHPLLDAALRTAIGRDRNPLTGDLRRDIRESALQAQAILGSAPFRAVLPEIVRDLLQQRAPGATITYDMVAPNRGPIADEYVRLAPAAGLRTDVHPDMPLDLVVGSLLASLLATGIPPTVAVARQVGELVIAALSVPGKHGTVG